MGVYYRNVMEPGTNKVTLKISYFSFMLVCLMTQVLISQVSLILLVDMILLDLVDHRTPSSPIYFKLHLSLHPSAS